MTQEYLDEGGGGRSNEMSRYIEQDPNLVCPWAKIAEKQQQIAKITLPPFELQSDVPSYEFQGPLSRLTNETAIHESLMNELGPFLRGETEACILISEDSQLTELHEFNVTWSLYAHIRTAAHRLCNLGSTDELLDASYEVANAIYHPDRINDYVDGQMLPNLEGEALHYFAMTPFGPEEFPRRSPLSFRILAKATDVVEAKIDNRLLGNTTWNDFVKRSEIPYNTMYPHVIPGDWRFSSDEVIHIFALCKEVNRRADNVFVSDNLLDVAIDGAKEWLRRGVEEGDPRKALELNGGEIIDLLSERNHLKITAEQAKALLVS